MCPYFPIFGLSNNVSLPLERLFPVLIVLEDRRFIYSAHHDVMHRSRNIQSCLSGHVSSYHNATGATTSLPGILSAVASLISGLAIEPHSPTR